jgi:segregation and condensation protein B
LGRRRDTPGRPITFVTTSAFLGHFGLESARDLPGIKELREAGLLESTPPGGDVEEDGPEDMDGDIEDMFGEEPE